MADTVLAEQPRYPTSECSSCKAPIIWAVTKQLRKIPVDAEPVDANNGGGNILLDPGDPPWATVVTNPALLFGKTVYRSHFVTCPWAERHRKPRARRGTS